MTLRSIRQLTGCVVFLWITATIVSAQDTTTPPASPAPSVSSTESASTAPPTAKPVKPLVIPYVEQPYRISITLGFSPDLRVSFHETTRVVEQFTRRVESRIGKSWNSDIELAPASEPRSRPMLDSIRGFEWNARMEPSPYDKRFALTIDQEGTSYRISGIEWDRSSQSTTQIHTERTYDRRRLAAIAADLTFRLFRPLLVIEASQESRLTLRIRGGEFLPHDPSLMPLTAGEFISPYIRHYGKKREFLRVQQVPWTAIRVEQVDRGFVQGSVISSFGAPLAAKRRRTELLGMKVNPEWPSTKLKVIPRGKPQSPMAGYRVEVFNRPETKEDKVDDRLKLRTDRNGEVTIPADPAHALQYLVVYSGKAPLAKAPLIPGQEPKLVLSAPDDAPRMNVEAETDLLQSELVDLVARREVLMARARGAAKKENWTLVTELTAEVSGLPSLEAFQARIDALQLPAIQAARRNRDKGQESHITRMCKQISNMATQYLDPIKIKDFLVEMEDAKKNQ